ncbi:hypothetical protein BSKO_11949 [Bryopsis sp. KO-2023]|nr:hypothetical protein BSKO_11949 [Bryopsis sp. KO-2023]
MMREQMVGAIDNDKPKSRAHSPGNRGPTVDSPGRRRWSTSFNSSEAPNSPRRVPSKELQRRASQSTAGSLLARVDGSSIENGRVRMRFPPLRSRLVPEFSHPLVKMRSMPEDKMPADAASARRRRRSDSAAPSIVSSVRTGSLRKKFSDDGHRSKCLHPPYALHPVQELGDAKKPEGQGDHADSVDTSGTTSKSRLPQGFRPGKTQPRSAPVQSHPKIASWSEKESKSLVNALHSRTHPRKTKNATNTSPSVPRYGARGQYHRQSYKRIVEEEKYSFNDISSESSKSSEDEASCANCDGIHQPTTSKEVLAEFGLSGSNKPSMFDREARHGQPGAFLVCASVSCGGRSNWDWKKENQDTFLVESSEKDGTTIVGVFDGHGVHGKVASTNVRDHLKEELRKSEGALWKRIRQDPEQSIKETREDLSRSGTTGVTVVIDPAWVLCAWAGDSRAVLGRKLTCSSGSSKFKAIDLSRDHKPDDPKEKKRILACNGRVDQMVVDAMGSKAGPSRVYLKYVWQPGLATSRSFGDTMAKMVGVTSEPEFRRHSFTPSDKIIILASDGVWEVVSSQEAVDIVGSYSDPHSAAEALVAVSQQRWLEANNARVCDDITATVCFLDHRKTRGRPTCFGGAVPSPSTHDPTFPCVSSL